MEKQGRPGNEARTCMLSSELYKIILLRLLSKVFRTPRYNSIMILLSELSSKLFLSHKLYSIDNSSPGRRRINLL